jgi:hypothetical protein
MWWGHHLLLVLVSPLGVEPVPDHSCRVATKIGQDAIETDEAKPS